MKQSKLLISLLIAFVFMVGINTVNAKLNEFDNEIQDFFIDNFSDYDKNCEKKDNCEVVCSYTMESYIKLYDKNVEFSTKIYYYKDEKWVVSGSSNFKPITGLTESNQKWSDLFSTSKEIVSARRVYIDGVTEAQMKKKECPKNFYINMEAPSNDGGAARYVINGYCFDNNGNYCKNLDSSFWDSFAPAGFTHDDGDNYVTSINGESVSRYEDERVVLAEPPIYEGKGCSGMFGEKVTDDINTALRIIRYIGPVLVIVLSILDFIKAVSSGDSSNFNDAWKKLLKRLIVALLLFFVVDLLKVILRIFDIIPAADCIK